MADGQPVQPPDEGQAGQASPEVAELKAAMAVLQQQLEDTKKVASEKSEAHHAAQRKMHEALNQLDSLKKQAEAAKLDITEEDAARLFDNPKKAFDFWNQRTNEITDRKVSEKFSELDNKLESVLNEVAKVIVERDQQTDQRLKTLDPRFSSPDFKAKKQQYGDILSDDQILQMVSLDSQRKPPSPPAGTRETPPKQEGVGDHIVAARDQIFGEVLKRYQKENK